MTGREDIIATNQQRLGLGSIVLHMTNQQWEVCVDRAVKIYRQRAESSQEESYAFLTLKLEQQTYTLPSEIMEIRTVLRAGYSAAGSKGGEIDPFSLSHQNLYLLQAGRTGGLLTYELYTSYLETAGKMFGQFIGFDWDSRTKKLIVHQSVRSDEEVLLWTWNYVPEETLFTDTYAQPWMEDWALAEAKEIEGQIRSKYSQIAGPQGGTTLNGADLIAAGQQEKEKLLEDIKNYVDGSTPVPFFIG